MIFPLFFLQLSVEKIFLCRFTPFLELIYQTEYFVLMIHVLYLIVQHLFKIIAYIFSFIFDAQNIL